MPLRAVCDRKLVRLNLRIAKELYPELSRLQLSVLHDLTVTLRLSICRSELLFLGGKWYVSHSGLLRIAHRRRCFGIDAAVDQHMSDASAGRWVFRATVRKSQSRSFVGYGDADPSNVSPLVHGAEMRVAETRAVNRALRKAYGIGICSVEEIGSVRRPVRSPANRRNFRHNPPMGTDYGGPQSPRPPLPAHPPASTRSPIWSSPTPTDFCGTKTLREATREQVENFVAHLADWAEKDRNALLCQLNSYPGQKEGAA